MKKITDKSREMAVYFLLWFPVTTLLQDKISLINKALFAVVFLFMALSILDLELLRQKKTIVLLAASILVYCVSLTYGLPDNINMLFYFPFFILYSFFLLDYWEWMTSFLKKIHWHILAVVLIWTILVIISMFDSDSYYTGFRSFTSSSFRLAPTVLFIMILTFWMIVEYHRFWCFIFDIIPFYCLIKGISRTYLVLGLLVLVVSWYSVFRNKKWFYISFFPLILVAAALVSQSLIMEKLTRAFRSSTEGFELLDLIFGNRLTFWSDMLNAYWQENIFAKLFGGGLNFTVNVSGFWAHNDFIEILCAHGVLGVLVYGYFMYRLLRVFLVPEGFKKRKMPVFLLGAIILVWLFNACFNMYYTYFCAMASYPILLIGIRRYYYGDGKCLNAEANVNCSQNDQNEIHEQIKNQSNYSS